MIIPRGILLCCPSLIIQAYAAAVEAALLFSCLPLWDTIDALLRSQLSLFDHLIEEANQCLVTARETSGHRHLQHH